MTPAEYVHRRALYERYSQRPLGILLITGAFFLAAVPFVGWVLGLAHPLGLAVVPLVWLVAARVVLARRARRRAEALGLVCRSCRAPIVGWRGEPRPGGFCRRCGAHVLDPAAPAEPERALFTRTEFVSRQARASRFGTRLLVGWLVMLTACLLLAPALWHVLPPAVRSEDVVYGALIVVFFVSLGALTLLGSAEERSTGMVCPVCGMDFLQPIGNFTLLQKGHCPRCDLLVMDDAAAATGVVGVDPGDRPAPPTTVAEYTARSDQLERATHGEYAVIGAVSTAALGTAAILLYFGRGHGTPGFYGWLLVGLLAALAFPVWGEWRWEKRARMLGLTCPSCGELLVGGKYNVITRSVLHDGLCLHCRLQLWPVPHVPPTTG